MKIAKSTNLIFLAGVLISLILLAASLPTLRLGPGGPLPAGGAIEPPEAPVQGRPPTMKLSLPVARGFLAIILIVLLILLPARLLWLADVKLILRWLLIIGAALLLASALPLITPGPTDYFPEEPSGIEAPTAYDYPVAPLGEPPQILVWLLVACAVTGMGILAFAVLKGRDGQAVLQDPILEEAQHAVGALKAGEDLKNVIIRCYFQFSRILQEEKGIERNHTLTVREFEHLLEDEGFPSLPVYQLTTLFEKARYGGLQMEADDEESAIESLNAIIEYCRRGRDQAL
jgi:hypothetical protein